jgi:hypothetical protein
MQLMLGPWPMISVLKDLLSYHRLQKMQCSRAWMMWCDSLVKTRLGGRQNWRYADEIIILPTLPPVSSVSQLLLDVLMYFSFA